MFTARLAHRARLLTDRDALHALAVAVAACLLSAGLVYGLYVVHVLRVARNAPCLPARADCVLVFGKHAPGGQLDGDFQARLARVMALQAQRPIARLMLLGGGAPGEPTEAHLAHQALLAQGLPPDAPVQLEALSRDTLQNLRNARSLLRQAGAAPAVTLLSSRYHLARCALFARHLGLDWRLCAAESRLRLTPATLWRLGLEAGYVCWIDLGARWARLTGNRRLLARMC